MFKLIDLFNPDKDNKKTTKCKVRIFCIYMIVSGLSMMITAVLKMAGLDNVADNPIWHYSVVVLNGILLIFWIPIGLYIFGNKYIGK
jgi:hypothetical protein